MSKKLTQEEFIEQATKVHHGKYTYEKVIYTQRTSKIIITCPIHGDFVQMAGERLKGVGCAKCQKKAKHTTESFIEESIKVHGNKYQYDKVKYIQNKSKVIITCPEHGDFTMKPNSHLLGQGCPKCGTISRANKQRKTTAQFIKEAKLIHGNAYDYSLVEYTGKDNKVKIICPKHEGIRTKSS